MRRYAGLGLAMLGLLVLSARAPAEVIGVLSEVSGETRLLRGDNYIEAVKGVELETQDIVETAGNAAAQLDMDDGSSLRLGPDTRLALTEYRLDSSKNVIAAGLDLLSGWLRFAVSKLKNPQSRYQVSSSMMTLGIRGTEGVVEATGEQGALHLETGLVDVTPADGAGAAPQAVAGGEYVQRQRGQALRKMAPPTAFAARVPPAMRARLARRALAARERGVPPRIVRAITREEARRFIENHPHARERLQRRFQHLHAPGARRDLKVGDPRNPAEASEALRRRYSQEQKGADPRLVDKLQRKPYAPPPGQAGPHPQRPGGPGASSKPPAGEKPAPPAKSPPERKDDDGPGDKPGPQPPHRPGAPLPHKPPGGR